MEAERRRFVGIDLGKREYTMAVIGKTGKMSLHQGKTSIQGRQALYKKLVDTQECQAPNFPCVPYKPTIPYIVVSGGNGN
jgi:hypothetical protein